MANVFLLAKPCWNIPYFLRQSDYGIILTGEICMLMDNEEDEASLRAGDVVVQRGTNHAWANRGTEPCTVMFVLIDGVTKSGQSKGVPNK